MNGNTTHDSSHTWGSQEAYVGLGAAADSAAGVASLDSTLVQQTKSEIRSLAAEIAQLAQTALEPAEFYAGFLPRLCLAMGAKAAAVWHQPVDQTASLTMLAQHSLPAELLSDGPPLQAHQRILRCVAAEGEPILVPPGNVKLDAERPNNPLLDALIVIPIRIQDSVEYLLEVVQRPSGGPATQRGYLRFVAQMADLMSDYLRRQQLRNYAAREGRMRDTQEWLLSLATAPNLAARQQVACEMLCELLGGERAILLQAWPRIRVSALSGSQTFDPRSEIVLAAQALRRQLARGAVQGEAGAARDFTATDRRHHNAANAVSKIQTDVDTLCHALGCRQLCYLPLDAHAQWVVLIAYADSRPELPELEHHGVPSAPSRLAASVGALITTTSPPSWLGGWSWPRRGGATLRKPTSRARLLQVWLGRLAVVGLLVAVGLFPVPQQISATAILQPLSKQMYYAPASGIVSSVLVSEGQEVSPSQPLLKITSHELETAAENLKMELKKTQNAIAEKTNLLNRGQQLSLLEKDELEYALQALQTAEIAYQQQLVLTQQRIDELTVTARTGGRLSTWDLQNRLLNHPVQPGQLLAATFDPQGKWRLQIALPDYRAGLVEAALAESRQGALPVHFSLTSHPDQLLTAYATRLAPQVTVQAAETPSASARIVPTEALIPDADSLPLKKDGAIARATLDCGKVPLCWLVFRDAYWAVSSRLKMMW